MIVLEGLNVCRTCSSWHIEAWCKPRGFRSGMLIGSAERLCMRWGNRCC